MGNALNRKYFIAAGDQTHFSAAGAMTNTDDERLLMSKDISSFVIKAVIIMKSFRFLINTDHELFMMRWKGKLNEENKCIFSSWPLSCLTDRL